MHTIQNVIFPEQGICTEADLYYRLKGPTGVSGSSGTLHLGMGAKGRFNTYFNALSIGKWYDHCALENLGLEITGKGKVELRVFHAIPDRSGELLACEVLTLSDTEKLVDLSHYKTNATRGVIYFEVKALSDAKFTGARFTTKDSPTKWPKLAISITTFKREAEVQETAKRLEAFVKEFKYGENLYVQVVDNGQSAKIATTARVEYMPNPNLGGSGGFARGLMEAKARGDSHCLFMDDDATFHMENIQRAYMMLALAKDNRTAVAGAMITNTRKWAMWENGAVFDGCCKPQFLGRDLRHRDDVLDIEFISARETHPNFYGGWWFFAFAIEHAEYYPFPFFVRGDDISFSLANDFYITTLNGVVSFQDDFTEKESPMTLYLDLRNHIIHHLIFDQLDRGRIGCVKVALRFILRSLSRFHYETAEAQLLSWQDMIQGPEFFTRHIDMTERRGSVKALTQNETWHPVEGLDLDDGHVHVHRHRGLFGRFMHRLYIFSLNGHFLPFFNRWGDHVILPMAERAHLDPCWGAKKISYLNIKRDKGYTVHQSKLRFFGFLWRLMGTSWRFVRDYDKLRQEYREQYPKMASDVYWQGIIALKDKDKI